MVSVSKQPFTSTHFAWLPADFVIDPHGHVAIQSYINGLHPTRHAALYDTVARVFERCVPLLERVLTDLRHPRRNRVQVGEWWDPEDEEKWRFDQEDRQRARAVQQAVDDEALSLHGAPSAKRRRVTQDGEVDEKDEKGEDGDEDDEEEREEKEDEEMEAVDWETVRPLYQPEVFRFHPPPHPPTVVHLRGRTVQVIVQMVTIRLTPSQPSYGGGAWRVEGMRNESIIASAVSYYSQDNVSDGHLAFRQAVDEPVHDPGDDDGLRRVYGLRYGDVLVQPLGEVPIFEGQSIAFPNVYQHRESPFSLVDPTRPGHRSYLAFYLVDPTQRVLSTARVPPQQAEWMEEGLAEAMADSVPVKVLQALIV